MIDLTLSRYLGFHQKAINDKTVSVRIILLARNLTYWNIGKSEIIYVFFPICILALILFCQASDLDSRSGNFRILQPEVTNKNIFYQKGQSMHISGVLLLHLKYWVAQLVSHPGVVTTTPVTINYFKEIRLQNSTRWFRILSKNYPKSIVFCYQLTH